MKVQFNLTTSECDLDRYRDRADFETMLRGFDGVELMWMGDDTRGIVPPECVVGFHMRCAQYWLDFWNGDLDACVKELGSMENVCAMYGGDTREALIAHYRAELARAKAYGAEYVVFHVSDSGIAGTLRGVYRHTDEAVIDASCALLNAVFDGETEAPALLLENLWEPGLTFTRPEMTARLLDGVAYPNKGLLLDTGHLMHTNASLRTQEEAIIYIRQMLAAHGALAKQIRGVHLHQSLTGAYMMRVRKNPPVLPADAMARSALLFEYVFRVDRHLPFTCPGVRELVEEIEPEYVTFEFISSTRLQHRRMLNRQMRAMGML